MKVEDIYRADFFPQYNDEIRKQIREAAYWFSTETKNGVDVENLANKISNEIKRCRTTAPVLHMKIALLFLVSENIIKNPYHFVNADIEKALNFVRHNFGKQY